MAKASRRRFSNSKRRRAVYDPKPLFLLVCEDTNSAPLYFAAIKRVSNANIEIIPGAGTPEVIAATAVEEATKRGFIGKKGLDWYAKSDQVWAVFDRDEHHHFDRGVKICAENGIFVARSNPCFEIWLILHHEDFHRPDGRHQALDHLCSLCPEYKEGKGRSLDYVKLIKELSKAEARAEAQLNSRSKEGKPFGPPSTTVFELTRAVWKKRS
ncbi:RloB family protein [Bradyrhizobium sp. AZCC 1721]|uniref:RloB family protein n=1 Tax=Bradyrhizobium sp. AZCC 1721 TaxID=3117016 RepID=UPI002FF04382